MSVIYYYSCRRSRRRRRGPAVCLRAEDVDLIHEMTGSMLRGTAICSECPLTQMTSDVNRTVVATLIHATET